MRTRPFALGVALSAAALSTPIPSRADSPQHTAGTQSLALDKFEEGKRHYDHGDFDRALTAFQTSFSVLPSPNTRLYVGRCFRKLGKTASASIALRLAAREAEERLSQGGEKRYAATRDAASAEAVEVSPSVPRLVVGITSPRSGVHITLDGQTVPEVALVEGIEVDPGIHAVHASADGYAPRSWDVKVAEGEKRRLEGALVRLAGAVPAVRDLSRVDTHLTPTSSVSLGLGRSRVVPKWVTLGVAAIGVATIGLGAVFAMQATSASRDANARDPLERSEDERSRTRGLATGANALFIAGGVLVAGSGGLAFFTKWSDGKPTASVAPALTTGSFGIAAGGRF